ncbi:hypothetical protein CKM354_000776500 [Cercospora kikuchii]|uniref:Heterokaryon incompatibility domain-containing protein n=1 Tax=Cercospora kikuchii TaxID=84275 RepID=A0A9P3CQ40_9PEZI|nr:uncharacterized protein CKM354_000776500 [Cercospora kikuchii]GIZ44570.1 hypothetical protein CKM354_000776500 [Cercospora kikuchii]
MDHLWLDREMQLEPEMVPYYEPGELKYSRNELDAWTNRLRSAMQPDSPARSTATTGIFIQECMFFGLLTEFCAVFGIEFRRDDFVTTRNDEQVLTTARLHLLAKDVVKARIRAHQGTEWLDLATGRPESQEMIESNTNVTEASHEPDGQLLLRHLDFLNSVAREAGYDDLREAAENLLRAWSHLMNMMLKQWSSDRPFTATLISCCVLLESLTRLSDFALGIRGAQRIRIELWTEELLDDLWLRRCRHNRLCPQRVECLMYSGLAVTQTYIATSIIGHDESDHGDCRFGQFCRSSQAQIPLPAHTRECAGKCDVVLLASDQRLELERSIEYTGYGLLRFGCNSLDNAAYSVCTPSAEVQYVAFSHVSHGLGNPLQNGLPACQLLRLKRIMQQADCATYAFWLDPLCVPLNSDWKSRAVEKMDEVYRQASKVIVVDRDLMRCRGNNIFRRMCMLMSDWITRIWTLQEAVLPGDKLFVAFADGVKHVNSIIKDWWDENGLSARSVLVSTDETLVLQSMLCVGGTELVQLVENFHNRATTRREDEAICLAILLGIDLRSLPPRFTIQDVLNRLPGVAQDIIFAPGARCDRGGFRWCPDSFMSATRRKTYEARQVSVQTGPKGIRMEKDVMLIGSLDFKGFLQESPDTISQYILLLENGVPQIIALYDKILGADRTALRPRYLRDAALVFEKSSDLDDEPSAVILVSNARSDGEELRAQYECILLAVDIEQFDRGSLSGRDGIVELAVMRLRETIIWVD